MHPNPILSDFNIRLEQIDRSSLFAQCSCEVVPFHPFSKLPSEIRLAVWRYAAPQLQFVEVRYNQITGRFWSCSPPPTLLHVNRESRHTLIYDMKYVPAFKTRAFPACILLSYEHSRIQLPLSSLRLCAIPDAELRYIRFLELKCTVEEMGFYAQQFLSQQLGRFQSLSIISVLVDKPPSKWNPRYEQLDHINWKELVEVVAYDKLINSAMQLWMGLRHHFLNIEMALAQNPDQEWPRKIPRVIFTYLSRSGGRFWHITDAING